MATYTATIKFNTPTSSSTITTNKPFSDALRALLTQTSDTGQANWGSITATSTTTFYEVFRLNDSLDSTYPLYLKVTYTAVASSPHKIFIQFGTGSDGAGTLSGASASICLRGFWATTALADATSRTFWASAGEGYLNVFGGMNPTQGAFDSPGGFCLSVERLRTAAGVITGDGIAVVATANASSNQQNPASPGGGTVSINAQTPYIANCYGALRSNLAALFSSSSNVWPPVTPRGGTYLTGNIHFDGTNYLAGPLLPYAGKLYGQMVSVLICDPIFAPVATLSLSMYGTAHTYYVMNSNLAMIVPAQSTATLGGGTDPSWVNMLNYAALRYE